MIGKTISHFRILEKLGSGGMGVVYKAEDTRLKRLVALKFLPDELIKSPQGLERFQREARAASALNHPHICTIHDIDEAEGRPFIAMELLEGVPLRARVQGRPLPIRDILDLGVQLADALDAAHSKGILHRDIKPENIFISPRGTAKLLDFGIAKLVAEPTDETIPTITLPAWVTAPGVAVGTVAYMSPEQVRGEPLDARTDLFSFGVVLYEMATGVKPFGGATSGAVCTEIQTKAPTAPVRLNPEVPAELEQIINKALEKEARLRYQSAKDLLVDLERLRRSLASGIPALGRPAEQASIAVLPFENLSPDPDNAFFADGLTEELIADLSKVQSLRVISRTSAMMYKGAKKSAPAIAQELGVRYVLEGSVRRAGDSLRITAQLIDSSTDAHLWAEKYSGTLEDVFDLQERLSRQIVEALKVELTQEEDRRLAARPIQDVREYDAWLRARHEIWTGVRANLERGLALLTSALTSLGESAVLHAGLGSAYTLSYDLGISHEPETLARAERHATRAVELAPSLPLALHAMGHLRYKQGDFRDSVRWGRRAIKEEPIGDALMLTGWILAAVGRSAEARELVQLAVESDPMNDLVALARGVVEFLDGRFEEAQRWLQRYLEKVAPGRLHLVWWRAWALAYQGRRDEAVAEHRILGRAEAEVISDLSFLYCLASEGDIEGMRQALRPEARLHQAALTDEWYPNFIAACLAMVGDYEGAIDWLERAVTWGFSNHRFLGEHSPFLVPLRGHPRFGALMERAREKQRAFDL